MGVCLEFPASWFVRRMEHSSPRMEGLELLAWPQPRLSPSGRNRQICLLWLLYCTVLYCTVLYCIVLYCIVLYRTVLYYTVLYSTIQYLYNTVQYNITLFSTVQIVLYSTII